MDVPAPAHAALADRDLLASDREVVQLDVRRVVVDHGPDGDAQHQILAGRAVLILVAALLAAFGLIVPPVLEVEQRREARICDEKDAAAATAIAAIHPAMRVARRAPERGDAVPTISGFELDDGLVDELHGGCPQR